MRYEEYSQLCLVDECILDRTEPVECIFRAAVSWNAESDEPTDSGWRILGRIGDATSDEVDARKRKWTSVGAVLNIDDSWLEFVDAPVGINLMRDFVSNTYIGS